MFEIVRNINVPTGNICIMNGNRGKLEFLSIGDYGKENNIKADFMGLTREINGVEHTKLLPLEEKWVITISSQYGCSMGCTFCDVPKVGKGKNATVSDLVAQVKRAIDLHPEVKHTKRLNLHYARMGEPTFNEAVLESVFQLKDMFDDLGWKFHPVISTMLPVNNVYLFDYLQRWLNIKNVLLNGEAGLQLSINTTDEVLRNEMFNGNACKLIDVSNSLKSCTVIGRKITLNFALTEAPIDHVKLAELFDPKRFMCKITPIHMTKSCETNHLLTPNGYNSYYPYQDVEERLKSVGFDVIVFVPSKEEDESRITCGNAILAEQSE